MSSAMLEDMTAPTAAAALQDETRQQNGFDDAESSLSSHTVGGREPLTMMSPARPNRFLAHPVTSMLALLGDKNPLPVPIAADDEVWLLDNTAYQNPDNPDEALAEFVVCIFNHHSHTELGKAVEKIASLIGLEGDAEAKATMAKRLIPFLMDIQPGRQVVAQHGEEFRITFSPSGVNGIANDVKSLPASPAGSIMTIAEVEAPPRSDLYKAKTFFTEPDGWGFISDIDDTIKITMTDSPTGILKSTFVDKPTPITGMPELYSWVSSQIGEAASWFYLSASPYNLYPFLRSFREAHYPHGTMILRDASWMSLSGLLSNLTLHTQEYKVDRMQKIHSWLPNKKMICCGDSTQADPESYGEIYRKYPGWVKIILIRKVLDVSSVGVAKNAPERFTRAFHDIPDSAWHVFEDPAECYKILEGAFAENA